MRTKLEQILELSTTPFQNAAESGEFPLTFREQAVGRGLDRIFQPFEKNLRR
jgi:hypothetical protein